MRAFLFRRFGRLSCGAQVFACASSAVVSTGPVMRPPLLPRLLVPRLPFFYGWVVLGCICLAGFARQGPAVAVLSVFVVPMTDAFGWSRTEMAGAVSLGGVLAAFVSPMLGQVLDPRGSRLILCVAALGTGLATMALSLTQSRAVVSRPCWFPPRTAA